MNDVNNTSTTPVVFGATTGAAWAAAGAEAAALGMSGSVGYGRSGNDHGAARPSATSTSAMISAINFFLAFCALQFGRCLAGEQEQQLAADLRHQRLDLFFQLRLQHFQRDACLQIAVAFFALQIDGEVLAQRDEFRFLCGFCLGCFCMTIGRGMALG